MQLITGHCRLCPHKLDINKQLQQQQAAASGNIYRPLIQQAAQLRCYNPVGQCCVACPVVLYLQGAHGLPGQLILTNTVEAFRKRDKAALLQQSAAQIWADIMSGAAEQQPALLCRWMLLVYGDLKHFVFHYW